MSQESQRAQGKTQLEWQMPTADAWGSEPLRVSEGPRGENIAFQGCLEKECLKQTLRMTLKTHNSVQWFLIACPGFKNFCFLVSSVNVINIHELKLEHS